jgi:hypothetical protein
MKQMIKLFLAAAVIMTAVACDKKEDLPFYKTGTVPVLSSSASAIAAAPSDSNKTVVTYSWTNPGYATDSTTVKYIVEIDSAGRNFSKAAKKEVSGTLSTSFTGAEINAILIGYGFNIGTAYDMDVRVTSSYANNNDQYKSNVLKMKMTPYKIPPKIPVPAELIMVGDATVGGWDNPAKPASQAIAQTFAKLDETTYGGIFYLYGNSGYLMLPKTGNWDHKFGGTGQNGGELLVDGAVPSSNTPTPNADGWYKIIVDFQKGVYTVTPVANPMPDNMYGIGDATAAQWDNTAVGGQGLPRLNSVIFEGPLALEGGKNLKFISVVGQWQPQFGKGSADGILAANYGGGNDPGTITPATTGNYKIRIDLLNYTYTLTKL